MFHGHVRKDESRERRVTSTVADYLRRWCVLLPLLPAGCTIHVTPPAALNEPAEVYLADYGRHSSLILPRQTGRLVEYAYGEWEWFAMGHTESTRIIPVLCWPTPGTLGRREIARLDAPDRLRAAIGVERILALRVEAEQCQKLLRRLDERFAAGEKQRSVYSTDTRLEFVPDPAPYWIFSDCNTMVADWLRELGCDVRGGGAAADFEVRSREARR
ncbi:MAG: hypothetical protein CHACPFDD_03336 [Phycisphaerae bacterium]|nr:hypothetical protein [Phycisphaerae bacterium]